MASNLDLVDNPARRNEAASNRCAEVAVVFGILAVVCTGISAVKGSVIVYMVNGGLAVACCVSWFFAGWFERQAPANDVGLSARDSGIVEDVLKRHGAERHYRTLVHFGGPSTYASVRDRIAQACVQASQGRSTG
jgi:hypothetical protein